jgi:CheY-like chemotaxis protein
MKRIVIIEDNRVIANVYRAALSKEGFSVQMAHDGQSALALLAGGPPDLVMLDLMLPAISGLDVLRQMRANPDLSNVPVIVMSNSFTPARMDEVWQAGVTAVLTKASSSPREIVRVVREALG